MKPLLPAALGLCACSACAAPAGGEFFDDFAHADTAAMRAFGWTLRDRAGHPGVPGAAWAPEGITLQREGRTTLLRLSGRTDGTPAGTQQAQLCQQRKVLRGTYAARVRFGNAPTQGVAGDPVIQSFYAVAPLRHDFDPTFSEIDWEYLAQGGWGSPETRLYAINWQTVRLDPWQAHNAAHAEKRRLDGWHVLQMQVRDDGTTHWFVDGRRIVQHGGRNQPVLPMAISFSLWFSPTGLLPAEGAPRHWQMDVDWVFHAAGRVMTPATVTARVQALRQRGRAAVDTVAAAEPPLPSTCDF
ncbi:MAG: hypothetical protein RJA10_1510 [Pseudomonadota bacterium]|jgi:hypothetical protein